MKPIEKLTEEDVLDIVRKTYHFKSDRNAAAISGALHNLLSKKINEMVERVNELSGHWHEYKHEEPRIETTTGPITEELPDATT